MPKLTISPADALQSKIEEYQTNPFALSKQINLSYNTVQKILSGKARITVPTAMKLGKYFGQSPIVWTDIQTIYEMKTLESDKKFVSMVNKIPKAQKPAAKAKATAKGKTNTLAEKRKNAAKVPGARGAKRAKAK